MAHDVFISYASGDKTVADAVCASLESHGVRCWIAPRDVLPGLHYGEAIIDAIHECRIMVLVFSSKANLSGHIPKEIERAVSQGSTIMPLRIEDVLPAKSLDYFIGSVHWLDALTPPLEAHLERLSANVRTLLARGVPVAKSNTAFGERMAAPPPQMQPMPAAAPSRPAPPAKQPTWMYAAIGSLIAIVLVLGFVMLRSRSETPSADHSASLSTTSSATPPGSPPVAAQTNARPAPVMPEAAGPAIATASKIAASTAAANAAAKKASATAAEPPAKPASPNQPSPAKAAPVAEHSRNLVFHETAGSTVKLEQLIGDQDKERHQPTGNQTNTRYGIEGAELGTSFEHDGHAYFLFGDIVGDMPRWPDALATSDATDPESGVHLDFLTRAKGRYVSIQPAGINMGANGVPLAGISLKDQVYVAVRTNDPRNRRTEHSVLTKFTPPANFESLRTISQMPSGRFLKMSLHEQPEGATGFPPGGPWVLMWGTGAYRESDAYLAIVPAAQFESGAGTKFFAGMDTAGAPKWSGAEADAQPVVKDGTLGDLSVTWCKDLGLWLMTYDRRTAPAGITFSYSRTPWGPWSEPQLIFNGLVNGALGKYIHNPRARPNDGLAGPLHMLRNEADPEAVIGGAYAPYMVERWTRLRGNELDIYYTMSTLNPYVVVLMKSRLSVE
ncbi:MAG: DUF4185 domain-containing protein [Acidobacteriia bacterium]|nr:DUF4185 domain-containing protein [Terriglobia bacterium]